MCSTKWCLLYDVNPDATIWFDSMGAAPPTKVMRFVRSTGKPLQYNPNQLQQMGSIVCGYWCEAIAKLLWNGYTLEQILNEFKKHSPAQNDSTIKKKYS